MAKAAPEGLITALDIGSSKVSAMIAQKGDGGELIVLGTGQRESRGVKRGYIADMAATELAVREAVEQAERIAGTNIENVWVSFSAGGLVSDVASVELAWPSASATSFGPSSSSAAASPKVLCDTADASH